MWIKTPYLTKYFPAPPLPVKARMTFSIFITTHLVENSPKISQSSGHIWWKFPQKFPELSAHLVEISSKISQRSVHIWWKFPPKFPNVQGIFGGNFPKNFPKFKAHLVEIFRIFFQSSGHISCLQHYR